MIEWIRLRLARDARFALKMWSLRLSLGLAALMGIWMALPAFENSVPPFAFLSICIAIALAIAVARLTGQKFDTDV